MNLSFIELCIIVYWFKINLIIKHNRKFRFKIELSDKDIKQSLIEVYED